MGTKAGPGSKRVASSWLEVVVVNFSLHEAVMNPEERKRKKAFLPSPSRPGPSVSLIFILVSLTSLSQVNKPSHHLRSLPAVVVLRRKRRWNPVSKWGKKDLPLSIHRLREIAGRCCLPRHIRCPCSYCWAETRQWVA